MEADVKSITINGTDYVPKDSVQREEHAGAWKIMVLQRGWVMVGKLERDGSECKLHHAAVIRNWGTKKGLPELCSGPLTNTKLDRSLGVVEFDYLTVVAAISVEADKWAKELSDSI